MHKSENRFVTDAVRAVGVVRASGDAPTYARPATCYGRVNGGSKSEGLKVSKVGCRIYAQSGSGRAKVRESLRDGRRTGGRRRTRVRRRADGRVNGGSKSEGLKVSKVGCRI